MTGGATGCASGAAGAAAEVAATGLAARFTGLGATAGAAAAPLPAEGNASLRRRTTGASMVDDADFTNSPMSFRRASSVLLSVPSSFASS